ncbi:hypothetical protein ACF3NG_09840 [Aerococcaceae bacterium WGS1372]
MVSTVPAVIRAFISDKDYERYIGKMNSGKVFERLLRIGFIAPFFPDDVLCMIVGMSKMSFRQFIGMVIAYRPIFVFTYTFMISTAAQRIFDFFK